MAATASLAAIREQLPLPLARLADRYEQCRGLQRVYAALYVWEASLKLLASTALIEFAALRDPRQDLEALLYRLARPSDGDLWRILRELTGVLSQAGHKEFQGVEQFLLTTAHRDMPRAAGLESTLKDVLSPGEKHSQATVTLRTLYDRLVQFRNTIAHKSFAMLPTERHDEIAKVLAEGMADILRRHDVLAGCQLIWVQDVKQSSTSGDWQVDRWALTGVEPKQLEALEFPRSETEQLPRTQWLYLHPAGVDLADPRGLAPDRLLHPLLYYDHNIGDVCFLNADVDKRKKKRIADLYCYSVGEQQRKDLVDDLRQLLQRLLAKPVTRQQIVERAAEALDEDTIGNGGEDPTETDDEPKWLGEFELLNVIGHGAMGVVYRAWQPMMGREVALKRLKGGGEDTRARFRNEISALGRVRHPNVVKIYQYGAAGIDEFYTMELLPGADLGRVLRHLCTNAESQINHGQDTIGIDASTWDRAMSTAIDEARGEEKPLSTREGSSSGPKSPAVALEALNLPAQAPAHFHGSQAYLKRIADIGRQIAAGLHALHEMEVVHRDVKPSNIMITPDGLAVLTDLGLARIQMEESQNLTTEHFLGTVRYASPEQAMSPKQVDRRTDVYSLGVTLWELLTFRSFKDITPNTPFPQAAARLLEEAEPVRKYARHVPRDLEAVVMKCLDRDRAKRYDTAKELAEHLSLWLSGEPVPLAPPSMGELTRRWLWKHRWAALVTSLSTLAALSLATALVMGIFLQQRHQADEVQKKLNDKLRRYATMLATEKARAHETASDWPAALMWYSHAASWEEDDEYLQPLLAKVTASLDQYPLPVNAWAARNEIRQLGVVETEDGGPMIVTVDSAGRSAVGGLFASELKSRTPQTTISSLSPSAKALLAVRNLELTVWTSPLAESAGGALPEGFRLQRAAVSDDGSIVLLGQQNDANSTQTTAYIGVPSPANTISLFKTRRGASDEFFAPRNSAARTTLISPDGTFLIGDGAYGAPMSVWRVGNPDFGSALADGDGVSEDPPAGESSDALAGSAPVTASALPVMELTQQIVVTSELAAGRKRETYPIPKQILASPDSSMIATAGAVTSLWVYEPGEDRATVESRGAGEATHEVILPGEVDFWRFTAPVAGSVTVEMEAIEARSGGDCVVTVLDESLQVVGENYNRGFGRMPAFSAIAGTTYFLRVRTVNDAVSSSYRLRVHQGDADDDAGEAASGTELLLVRAAIWREIRREINRPSTNVVFADDDKRVLVCYEDGPPALWTSDSPAFNVRLPHPGARAGAFSPDGHWVATLGDDGVRVWNAATGDPVTPLLSSGRTPNLVEFDASGRWLAIASKFETPAFSGNKGVVSEVKESRYEATLWDLRCGEDVLANVDAATHVDSILPSATGDTFLITGCDGAWSVVDVGGEIRRRGVAMDERRAGAALASALPIVSARAASGRYPWKAEGSSLLARLRRDRTIAQPLVGQRPLVDFSPDGSKLAFKQSDQVVVVCNVRDAQVKDVSQEFAEQVVDLEWSPDGRRLAVETAGDRAAVAVWDVDSDAPMEIPAESVTKVFDFSFSPDGQWLVIASDQGVHIWNLQTPRPERIHGHFNPSRGARVFAARFTHDQTKMIIVQSAIVQQRGENGVEQTEGADGSDWLQNSGCEVGIWNLEGGQPSILERRPYLIDGLTFVAGGEEHVVTWAGTTVTCWNLHGKPAVQLVHNEKVDRATVSRDGSKLVTWSPRGLLRTWDTATGSETQLPVIVPGPVQFAGVAPNGSLWAIWGRTRVTCWPYRAQSDVTAAAVHARVGRRYGWLVDEERAKLRAVAHASRTLHAPTSPEADEVLWLRRQFADHLAADDPTAAMQHWNELDEDNAATTNDRIRYIESLLASGQWQSALEECETAITNLGGPDADPVQAQPIYFLSGRARLARLEFNLAINDLEKCQDLADYQLRILKLLANPTMQDCWPLVESLLAPDAPRRNVWTGTLQEFAIDDKAAIAILLCDFAVPEPEQEQDEYDEGEVLAETGEDSPQPNTIPVSIRRRALALLPPDLLTPQGGSFTEIQKQIFHELVRVVTADDDDVLGRSLPSDLRHGLVLAASQMELAPQVHTALLERLAADADAKVRDAVRSQQQLEQPRPQIEQRTGN